MDKDSDARLVQDLKVDPNALDIEWIRQPSLYYKYSTQAAEARKEMDASKIRLDVVLAQVQSKIRSNPDKYGLAKSTEAAIEAAVKQDPEVAKAQEDFLESKHNVALLESAVAALDQKKRALENLVSLHLGSYFAGPKVPRELDGNSVKNWQKERLEARMSKSLNKRKGE
jgi:hypothetical protein